MELLGVCCPSHVERMQAGSPRRLQLSEELLPRDISVSPSAKKWGLTDRRPQAVGAEEVPRVSRCWGHR